MSELGSAAGDECHVPDPDPDLDSDSDPDPMVEACRARVGQVLCEKWHLDALLGVGGMVAVYAATHRNGNRVAIKMLHAGISIHGHVRARFLREGYVAKQRRAQSRPAEPKALVPLAPPSSKKQSPLITTQRTW